MTKNNPYGDDAGTRVGKPDTPDRDGLEGGGDGGNLGAGKESTGGISEHGNPGPSKPSKSESPRRQEDSGSGYGGNKGSPKTSSDKR